MGACVETSVGPGSLVRPVAVLVEEDARLFLAVAVVASADQAVEDHADHAEAADDRDDAPDGLDHAPPDRSDRRRWRAFERRMPPAGIEPASRGVKVRRSNR